jgi:hypothetical protein
MQAFADVVIRHRKAILALAVVASIGAGALMTTLTVDTDFANYLSQADPAIRHSKEVGEAFGSNYTAVVLVESDDSFAPEVLRGIQRLTRGFQDDPGVASVISLTNVVDVRKTEAGLEVADLFPGEAALDDPAALAELRRYTLGKATYQNFLVSADGRFTALYVNIAENARKDVVAKALRARAEALWPAAGRPATLSFAGEPMMMNYLDHIIIRDMTVLVPLVVVLLVGILYLSFRTLRGVLLPLGAVLMATAVTFGLMGLTGTSLTLIAAIMPVVLLSNGSAYGIHMLSFIALNSDHARDSSDAVRAALRLVTVPILMSAITTFIGFMSFVLSVLTLFQTFGIFTAVGIAASLFFALTFIPAAVCSLKLPRTTVSSGGRGATAASFLDRPLVGVAHLLHDHPRTVLAVSLVLVLALVPGIFRLRIDFDMLSFFAEGSEPRRADSVMTREFGGSMNYSVHVRGPVKDPLVLGEMYRLHKHLRQTLGSSAVNSIAEVIADMNDSLNGQRAIPSTRAGVESLYLLMEGKAQLNQLVTPAADQALVTARLPRTSSATTSPTVRAVDDAIATVLRPQLVALPLDAVVPAQRPALAALVVDELLADVAADLAHAGRTLPDAAPLRPLLLAAVGRPPDPGALSVDDRQHLIASYLEAADCDLELEDPALRDRLSRELAALPAPTADTLARQLRTTAPALGDDEEGVRLAVAAIGARLGEEITRREHARLLDAILAASAPPGDAAPALASELRGELSRLDARVWPVTPARYASLVGEPPAADAIVHLSGQQSGQPMVFGTIIDRLGESQVNSLILCLVLVLIVLVIQMRSLRRGAMAMVPILATLAVNFGLMGYLGFTLNLATALIASLAIGIGIDYTIHTAYRLRIEARRGGPLRQVLERVFLTTGRAVLINALAVMGGFLVIVASELIIIKHFGGLSALSIGMAAIGALTIYPVLVITLDRDFLTTTAEPPAPPARAQAPDDRADADRGSPPPVHLAGAPGVQPETRPPQGGTP